MLWWNIQLGRASTWQLLFAGLEATAAVALAGLALYAAFFTSIPETLIRQLQSEVADTREELVGLRRERSTLLTQSDLLSKDNQIARSQRAEAEQKLRDVASKFRDVSDELTALQKQVSVQRAELEQLAAEREQLTQAAEQAQEEFELQLSRVSAQREKYAKHVMANHALKLADQCRQALDRYRRGVSVAKDYMDVPLWLEDERALDAALAGVRNIDEKVKIIENWIRKLSPEQLRNYLLFRWTKNGSGAIEDEARRRLIEVTSLEQVTGLELMERTLASIDSPLTATDDKRFKSTVIQLGQANEAMKESLLLNRDIILSRGPGASQEIARVERALSEVSRLLDGLGGELLK